MREQYQAGAMIKGEQIAVKARSIRKQAHPVKQNGKTVRRISAKLAGTAYCVIESQPAAAYNIGDSLKAEIINGIADKIGPIKVSAKEGTGRHKIQTTHLNGDAICVIERPLRYIREALSSQQKN